ncbi:hypothetical protein BDV19DRAFT_364195 [Aspergillus venezuelensis]
MPNMKGTRMCLEKNESAVSAHTIMAAMSSTLPIQSTCLIFSWRVILLLVYLNCRKKNYKTRATPPIGNFR